MAGFRSASSTTVVAGRASGPGRHAVDRWAPRSASRSVYSTPALTRNGFRRSSRRVGLRAVVDSACLALVSLALVNLVVQGAFGHWLAWVSAVVVAGGATLLALAAAEHGGLQQVQRWQLQAVAGAALMLMLMAAGVGDDALAAPALLLAGATAGALLATAAAYRSGPRWLARSLYLALDAGVLAVTTTLAAVALGSSTTAAGLIACSCLPATRWRS